MFLNFSNSVDARPIIKKIKQAGYSKPDGAAPVVIDVEDPIRTQTGTIVYLVYIQLVSVNKVMT